MKLFATQLLTLLLAGIFVVGCSAENKPVKRSSEVSDASEDQTSDNFTFDDATEASLDADAFLNATTKEDVHVATVYFEGGTGKNCAKWEVTVSGEELKLARGDRLREEDQTRFKETPEGTLVGSFETRGTIPGIRFVVKRDSIVTFSGVQSYCVGADQAEFSVQENVAKGKLHEIFRGVEVKGIAFMTLKFSDIKNAETVAKIQAQVAQQSPVPATTQPAVAPTPAPAAEPQPAPTPAP